MAFQPTYQPSPVPIADKSAGRKPLVIAIITIVILVGLTLSLFFLNIKTAGQAISIGKAGASQAGIFLESGASKEVNTKIDIPVKANLGTKKSTSFQFMLAVDNHFTYGGFSQTPLMNNLVVDGNDVSVITKVTCDNGVCNQNSKTVIVTISWFCADTECSNALTGDDAVLGEISLVAKQVGMGTLTFNQFDVYELGTGNDLIPDNGYASNIEITSAGCSASNLAACPEPACTANSWYWYDNSCHLTQKAGCTQDTECAAGSTCQAGTCVVAVPPLDEDGDGVIDTLDACSGTPQGVNVDATGCPPGGAPVDSSFPVTIILSDAVKEGSFKLKGVMYKLVWSWVVDTDGTAGLTIMKGLSQVNLPGGNVMGLGKELAIDLDGDQEVDIYLKSLSFDKTKGESMLIVGLTPYVAPAVCGANNPTLCKNIDECHTAGLNWNANPELGTTGCYTACPTGSSADASQNCVKPLGAAPCDKNNPATCTVKVNCNQVGLLWTEATQTCSACPVGTSYDPATDVCVSSAQKKIQINLEDAGKAAIAKGAKLKKGDTYTIKVMIAPEKVLPADHLVLVKISYGSVVKTSFVDKKSLVEAGGAENVEFTHDVAPDFTGDVKVDVFVWNNWPSTTGVFEALLPEGGNELEGGSVTYTVQ